MSARAVAICLAVLLALAGCSKEAAPPPPVRPVLSIVAMPQSAASTSFVGTIEPRETTEMAFRVGGTLLSRTVNVGDVVTSGEELANVDATTLTLAVQSAEADLSSAQAQLANAAAIESRQQDLIQSNNASTAALEQAQQQRQAAQANVVQAQSRLSKAQEQLGYAEIAARFDGVVTAVGAEVGEVVGAGQMVVTIARPDTRDIVIDVPEDFLTQVKIGTEFDVALQLDPRITTTGTLREIAPEAEELTRTRRLKIGLDNPPATFWLGTTAIASPHDKANPQLLLPASAIRRDGEATSIWVVDTASGTVKARSVEVGAVAAGEVPVLSGLQAGERVVTAGVNSLADGAKVSIEPGAAS